MSRASLKWLDQAWSRGTEFLGSRYGILGGAMSWVSDHQLVTAISTAGGFGVLACGTMNEEQLRHEIRATQAGTNAPFGVNLIVLHPDLQKLVAVCIDEKVSHVVLAGGMPPTSVLKLLQAQNIKTMSLAPSLPIAQKLVRLGVGALIIEGMEAGGHVGSVSTSVLAQEILPYITQVPIFVAGGIGNGKMIRAYLEMGASGCQLGTRFACAQESRAHPHFKAALIQAHARDAVLSQQIDPRFPVIPVRALANSATHRFADAQKSVIAKFEQNTLSMQEAKLEIEHFWAGALRRAVMEGDIESGSLMAGQSVGMVKAIEPVSQIIETLIQEAVDSP